MSPCIGVDNETGCEENKELNEGGQGEWRRAVIIDGSRRAMAEMRSFVSRRERGRGEEREEEEAHRQSCLLMELAAGQTPYEGV